MACEWKLAWEWASMQLFSANKMVAAKKYYVCSSSTSFHPYTRQTTKWLGSCVCVCVCKWRQMTTVKTQNRILLLKLFRCVKRRAWSNNCNYEPPGSNIWATNNQQILIFYLRLFLHQSTYFLLESFQPFNDNRTNYNGYERVNNKL